MRRQSKKRSYQRTRCRGGRRLTVELLETRAMMHAIGVLSGSVYFDTDGDGTRDASEIGIPGVVVQLSQSNSNDSAAERSTITDDHGDYTFTELEAGTYEVAKRQSPATIDAPDSTAIDGAFASENAIGNVVLLDDETLGGVNFSERGLRSEAISIAWFFASAPPVTELLRETLAVSEEVAGNRALAASIRAGSTEVPDGTNGTPVATNDAFSVAENGTLTINAAAGVLANDFDPDGDTLTAELVNQAANGVVALNSSGAFTYTPNTGFSGNDSFTYRANDGQATSNAATVTITVTPVVAGGLFGPVTPGSFENPNLLGIRTDQVPGAPPITALHRDGDIDYTGHSNPPTYGDHHGFDPQGADVNPGVTPRTTGIYTTEQPDEDLIHNLEHGHVWISYNSNLISAQDLAALEQQVRDGSPNASGGGVGVILTPRAANDDMIALASWARLLTLDSYDPATIRDFVETNRGQAPEGFITP